MSLRIVRHLLRHLNDPQVLARNELAARLFPEGSCSAAERVRLVRQRIETTAAAMQSNSSTRDATWRGAEIVVRCDLHGEQHAAVAQALGLSLRQFYRDRRRALERLTEELQACATTVAATIPASFAQRTRDLGFRLAAAQAGTGDVTSARQTLVHIATTASDIEQRLQAHIELASLAVDCRDRTWARTSLDDACRLFAAIPSPTRAAAAQLLLAESYHDTLAGERQKAASIRSRALQELRTPSLTRSARAVETIVRLHIAEADAISSAGDHETAIVQLDEAARLIGELDDPPPILRAMLLNVRAAIWMHFPGKVSHASAIHAELYRYACAHQLFRIAFPAAFNIAIAESWHGRGRTAFTWAQELLQTACATTQPHDRAIYSLYVAKLALAVGEYGAARELVAASEIDGKSRPDVYARALLVRAQLELRLEEYEAAAVTALAAWEHLGLAGAEELCGSALLYAAEGLAATQRDREALPLIEDAVARLERNGLPFSLAKAYRLSAKMTGRRVQLERAREIAAALKIAAGSSAPQPARLLRLI